MECVINFDVPELDPAIAFYEQALGLRFSRRLFDGTVAEMLGGPAPVYLLAEAAGTPANPATAQVRDYRRHWTPVHLDVVVADIDAAIARALDAGAGLEGAVQSFAYGRLATMHDPFGHGFCFLQWRGAGYDEVEDAPG